MPDQTPIDPSDTPVSTSESIHARRRRGIYLLPNLVTTAALFSGFYAIVSAMYGSFEKAAIAIYAAGILDAMDGRIARLTRTQSNFGQQYDSLSDVVAFGVAPALVCFTWALQPLGNAGWVAAFIYLACAALRLARFNTLPSSDRFVGLASPAAAGVVAAMVWVWSDTYAAEADVSLTMSWVAAAVITGTGLMMVSNFDYFSLKALNLKGRVPFISMLGVVLIFAVVFIDPPRVLLGMAIIYMLSGPAGAVWRRFRPPETSDEEAGA